MRDKESCPLWFGSILFMVVFVLFLLLAYKVAG